MAWAMYRFRKIRLLLGSFVYLCYPIPKLALLPVVMILAGLGDAGKITMIVLIILFQITINVRDSLNNIPKESFLVATSLGASTSKSSVISSSRPPCRMSSRRSVSP